MSHYDVTKHRIFQWLGIILIIGVFAGAYWYFQVRASTLNQSKNDSLTNGLIGLWSFNGDDMSGTTAYDRSGSGNNGTLTNGPVVTDGKTGQALSFDGSNDYATIGDPAALRFGSVSFSVSAWFKTTSSSFGYVLCDYSVNPTIIGLGVNNTGHTGKAMFFLRDNINSSAVDIYSATDVNDGQWHHMVGVRNASTQVMKLYLDGAEVASNTYTGTLSFATFNNWSIGQAGSGGAGFFSGSIDETRIYNTALSATEIQSLYTQGSGTKVNTAVSQPQGTGRLDSGLAGYWAMDDGSGTSAADSSTNGNAGTLTNGPTWTTGQIGGAVNFDGANDFILSPSTSYVNSIATPHSIFAWVYPRSYAASTVRSVLGYGEYDDSLNTIGLGLYDSTGKVVFLPNGYYSLSIDSGLTVPLNQWSFIGVTRTGTQLTFYANGSTSTVTDIYSWNVGIPDRFMIGASSRNSTLGGYFDGYIDEVRAYNRVLSPDEVNQLYRLNSPTGTDTSLKGYWSFNGKDVSGTTAYDRSGAGNTGTLTNGPTITEGKIGQGLSFDGVNDMVSVTDTAALSASNVRTVSLWVKRNSLTTNLPRILNEQSDASNRWSLCIPQTGDADENTIAVSRVIGGVEVVSKAPNNSLNKTNTWYHIVAQWDSSTVTAIYIDGVSQTLSTGATLSAGGTVKLAIGNRTDGARPFDGSIDEVRIYNRVLSAAEIKGLYDTGADDKVNSSVSQPQGTGRLDSGLAGYWAMDNGSGTSATDSSTNSNAGTLTGAGGLPTWTTGQVGGAVNFDGVDDYIATSKVVPDKGSLSVWVNTTAAINACAETDSLYASTDGSHLRMGFNSCSGGSYNHWDFEMRGGFGALVTVVGPSNNSSNVQQGWHFLTGTWDTGKGLSLYIDGILASTSTSTTGTFGSMVLDIGGQPVQGKWFPGKIDEARMYDRVLSADEVAQLYRLTAPTGVDTSLKGYWSFNGKDLSGTTAYDRSGAGNTGTLTNSPTITEGKIGQALSFRNDGLNVVTAANSSSLNSAGSSFTLSTWLYLPSDPPSGTDVYPINYAFGQYALYRMGFQFFSGTYRALLRNNNGGMDGTAGYAIPFTAGQWHLLTGTYDGTTLLYYLDGTQQKTASVAPYGTVLSFSLALGANNVANSMDEVRIYNRALSATEVAALYNQGR